MIPAGGSAIVEFKVDVPGTFIIVDHSIFRTFNKGSLGMLKVEGPDDKVIYSGKVTDEVYLPEGSTIQTVDDTAPPKLMAKNKAERMAYGKRIFESNCMACHQAGGTGIAGAFPPLAKSDFLNSDKTRAIQIVIGGKAGEITVNGAKFNGVMPAQQLSDEDAANVLTYVYGSWGNSGHEITPAAVKAERAKLKK